MITRRELKGAAEQTLGNLNAGVTAVFGLPEEQPGRRVLAQTINQVAHKLLGAGNYRMRSDAEGVHVTRLR